MSSSESVDRSIAGKNWRSIQGARSGTPEVHAQVLSLARVQGPKGAERQPLGCGASS